MNEAKLRFEDEVRGRLACLETLLMTFAAHTARHVDETGGDMVMFTSAVFDETENNLLQAAHMAAGTQNDAAALSALQSYRHLSGQMLAHVQREASRRESS